MKVQLLNYGYVEYIEHWGSDERIVEAARMSSGKGFLGWAEHAAYCVPEYVCTCDAKPGDEKLLAYLWKNRHTTPFEQCGLSIEVSAPIFVFREWHRHRTQSYNEMSARYTQMPNIHYVPSPERVRRQSNVNKQGTDNVPINPAVVNEFLDRIVEEQRQIYATYEWAIQKGIAREIARINTPVSRFSTMRASGNLLNWLRFLGLRNAPDAQEEIRRCAQAVDDIIADKFPRTHRLFAEKKI